PASLVRLDRAFVRRERPQLHLMEIQIAERVREQRRDRFASVPLPLCRAVADEDVEGTDAVATAKLVESDAADRTSLRLDDEGMAFRPRALLAVGDVLERERLLVVHPIPDFGIVLPDVDQGIVGLLHGAEGHTFAVDHPASAGAG